MSSHEQFQSADWSLTAANWPQLRCSSSYGPTELQLSYYVTNVIHGVDVTNLAILAATPSGRCQAAGAMVTSVGVIAGEP
jgi:hypothetical protein